MEVSRDGAFYCSARPLSSRTFLPTFLLLLLSFLLPSRPVHGQAGGQAGSFLTYGVGGRALGMGGAFYAVADDATASYWNPAGMAQLSYKEFSLMHTTLFEDTAFQFASYVHPTAGKGVFGLNMTQLKSAGFERVDITVDPTSQEVTSLEKNGTFEDAQRSMSVAWGRALTDKMAFGFSLKNVDRQLADSQDNFRSIDLGMIREMGPFYKLGIGVQNVIAIADGDTDDRFPLLVKFGNALTLFKGRLTIAMDLEKSQETSMNWRFGGEYFLLPWAAVRFGMIGVPTIQETDFGIGLRYGNFRFDFAQAIHDLGASTRMSVGYRFGDSNEFEKEAKAQYLTEQAFDAFRGGDFSEAVSLFEAAADADPGNRDLQAKLLRLKTAVRYIPDAVGGEELPTLIRKGIIEYVDAKDLNAAVRALRLAYNKEPTNERLLAVLNKAERDAGIQELTRKPDGPRIYTVVDQKIFDARQAIYNGLYDKALKNANDVLELEPNNETALEILGSAFFLMDQREKAKVYWLKVLEINPENEQVANFLERL